MYSKSGKKACYGYKSANEEIGFSYKRDASSFGCESCVFFSSQNCRMDTSDCIQPQLDFL